MATTTRMTGKDLQVTFAGGTVSGDFTTFSVTQTADTVDVTAGAETVHYYIPTRSDFTATLESFFDNATQTIYDSMAPTTAGTLIWSPTGTASGGDKFTCSRAIVTGRDQSHPFDGASTYTITFQGSAAITESAW